MKKDVILALSFAALACGIAFISAYADNETQAAAENVEKIVNSDISANEELNKELIEEQLPEEQKKIFDNKDVSDEAVRERQNFAMMLEAIEKKDTFFDTVEYKSLELYNINTREELEVAFWADGEYIPDALEDLDQFMRDWRRNQAIDVDPKLYSLLHDLHKEVHADSPIHLISGYRSRTTNDKLRAMGRNTAKKSQHVLGKAADIAIPDVPVSVVRKKALKMKRGGVGFYPNNGFVHIDTGRVRQWEEK